MIYDTLKWGGGDKGIKEKEGLKGFAKVKDVIFQFTIFCFFANKKDKNIYDLRVYQFK